MQDAATLPAGSGLRALNVAEFTARGRGLTSLMDLLLVFEAPRRRPTHRSYRYVLSADISDGIEQDRSSVDVVRVATLAEPHEQVAHFVTNTISPEDLAPVIDAIGHYYVDQDGIEAHAALETNNHGKSTQDLLQKHYGYGNFFVWQYMDKRQLDRRFSQAIGWATTPATRPILLSRLNTALKLIDPTTGAPGLIIHSPFTFADLGSFYSPTGRLADGEAARGAHDDCVISIGIANYAAEQLLVGETEPLAERRHRFHEEQVAREADARLTGGGPRDYRNTDCSSDEAGLGLSEEELDEYTEADVAMLADEQRE